MTVAFLGTVVLANTLFTFTEFLHIAADGVLLLQLPTDTAASYSLRIVSIVQLIAIQYVL